MEEEAAAQLADAFPAAQTAEALRHSFLAKPQTIKIVLHANNAAESPPPYYLSLSRGSYLHLHTDDIKQLFQEFYPFGQLSAVRLRHEDRDLPLELPFGALRDAFLAGELPCVVLRCASATDEPTPHYVDRFKQSLKEAAFVKSGSGEAFRHFSGPKTWRDMLEALEQGDYAGLSAAQRPLVDRFEGESCPVRVLCKGQNSVSGRRALRSETLEEFLRRSYPKLAEKCPQGPMETVLRVLCGGLCLPLSLRIGAVEDALKYGDLFVYLTLDIL